MGDIVEFKQPEKKFLVTVCDGDQNYQTFEAESVTRPRLEFETHEVWRGDDVIDVDGPSVWGPITIKGSDEIGYAIRYGTQPVRVTFESDPRSKNWWELQNVHLTTKSSEGTHIIRFTKCTEHNYDRTEPK